MLAFVLELPLLPQTDSLHREKGTCGMNTYEILYRTVTSCMNIVIVIISLYLYMVVPYGRKFSREPIFAVFAVD